MSQNDPRWKDCDELLTFIRKYPRSPEKLKAMEALARLRKSLFPEKS